MPIREQVAVKTVKIEDLSIGDKLLQDIVGYKDRVLINRKTVLGPRDIKWLKKKLAETAPKMPSQKYVTSRKAISHIKDSKGNTLVKSGQVITEAALAPLLKEGFTTAETPDNEGILFYKKSEWPKGTPFNISEFNPTVKVETTEQVNSKD